MGIFFLGSDRHSIAYDIYGLMVWPLLLYHVLGWWIRQGRVCCLFKFRTRYVLILLYSTASRSDPVPFLTVSHWLIFVGHSIEGSTPHICFRTHFMLPRRCYAFYQIGLALCNMAINVQACYTDYT